MTVHVSHEDDNFRDESNESTESELDDMGSQSKSVSSNNNAKISQVSSEESDLAVELPKQDSKNQINNDVQ